MLIELYMLETHCGRGELLPKQLKTMKKILKF